MSFVAAATAIGLEGVAANVAAGAMMGGTVKVGTNVLTGQDPFKDIGKGVLIGGLTGGLTPGVSEAFNVSMPMAAGITQGGLTALATGDITKGLMAGVGAYGMYGLTGAGEEMALNQSMSGPDVTGGEQVFGDSQAAPGSAGDKFNKYLTDPKATGAAAQANATGNFFKDNWKYAAMAAAPIMADLAAKNNMPQTVTQPGMIRPYSYDPYSGAFTAGTPYQSQVKKAADGGLMGMNNGGYNPGALNFAGGGDPVIRMAEGGVAGYAPGGYVPTDAEIFNYFKTPGLTDEKIAQDMQTFGVSAADIARATGTQNQQADYERRFVNAVATPTTDATEFMAAANAAGLQNQNLATALQSSGLSAADQYALTHPISDAAGTTTLPAAAQNFYNTVGYTAGALPGDQGGLEGLYANINYSAQGLQNQINAGKLTVQQAQNLALAEMDRVGVNQRDIKNATGTDFANLFKPKTETKTPIVCGPGYRLNAAGTACEPVPIVETPPIQCPTGFHYDPVAKACVPNTSATQNTSTTVTTPTSIATADKTALPVGVSGAGITTINPNGTVTTRPNIPGIPEGGFTGMESLRKAYTEGGGSLGYVPYTPKTIEEFDKKYTSKLTGGSKQAYDYLTGKTAYSPVPVTPTGEIMKPYAESVLGIPTPSSKKMYIFDPATKTYKVNPDYAIPTTDAKGNKSYALTNKDVASFMDTNPSSTKFYEWSTTNNLSPEQIATASGRPISEISKLYTGAQSLVDPTTGKIDPTKVAEQTTADEKANFDYAAYLKANPDVQAELDAGKANFGNKSDLAAAAWNHYVTYGKPAGRAYTAKAKEGGLMALARGGVARQPFFSKSTGKFNMASPKVYADGGMAEQFNLGGYSDGGRLLRGPGDGVSDSIPATIGNKQPARLADGEFVVPARIVSELGNGSTEAGARKLYAMMDRVQAARKGSIGKGKVAKNSRADKYLPV